MKRRHKVLAILFIAAIAAITLLAVLRGTNRDEQYGMARIRLAHQTIYVKQRQCASAGCNGRVWLSRSADRCKPLDSARDYGLTSEQVLYMPERDTLLLVADGHSVRRPTAGDWINMRFVPAFGTAAEGLPLQAIVFGERLPPRDVPTQRVTLNPCVRAFGLDWSLF